MCVPFTVKYKMLHIRRIPLICLSLILLGACTTGMESHRITLNYFEYNRGKSFPLQSDIEMEWGGNSLHFNNVRFEDDSFFPDDSIIPNAFLRPLFGLRFSDALKAFTEPYYGYRFIHFFPSNPRLGIGIEFTHHKLFLNQPQQQVKVSGDYRGAPIDHTLPVGDLINYLSISHGVNHLNILMTYRWLLSPTPAIPEGRLQPYISVGAGPAIPHLELKLAEDAPEWSEYSFQAGPGNFNFGVGLGIRFKFRPHLGGYFEYKYSYSHLHDLNFHEGEGSLKMSFPTHHLMWGISIIF